MKKKPLDIEHLAARFHHIGALLVDIHPIKPNKIRRGAPTSWGLFESQLQWHIMVINGIHFAQKLHVNNTFILIPHNHEQSILNPVSLQLLEKTIPTTGIPMYQY